MKLFQTIFLTIFLAFVAQVSQAIVLQWYIDNEVGSPEYDYAQLVVVSADKSVTFYSYLIEMDASGQHELIDPEVGTWSSMNLEEYLTRHEDGQTDPPIGYEDGDTLKTFNFTGYTFYFRMMDSEGQAIYQKDETGAIVLAASEERVFPQDLDEFYFDDAHITPRPWIININPIPEPTTGALALLGVGLLVPRRRKDSKATHFES